MLLHDLVIDRVHEHGSKTALIKGDESVDYLSLAQQVVAFANGLASLGLNGGDRVGILLNKCIEGVVCYFAVSKAGGVIVPINTVLKPPQVQHILNDCGVTVLATTATWAKTLENSLSECRSLRHIVVIDDSSIDLTLPKVKISAFSDLIVRSDFPEGSVERIDIDVAAILYTSGSTGRPKGVVLSHRNIVNGALSVASYLENNASDVILAVLPFSFDAGFSQLTTGFAVGASVVLLNYLLPKDVVNSAARYRVTGLTAVPPLWNQLAGLDWPDEAVRSIRYIASTGGPMPTTTLNALRQNLPRTKPFLMYGLTESFRSTYLPPEELDRRPSSIGKAIPDAEILVVREDGSICSPGEPGELVHRGALVSLGYWNDPERTSTRFKPVPNQQSELPFTEIAVWSGDKVVKDEDGFLFFVGRDDDMIKSSGYRISPSEVEEVVYNSGFVNECAALGVPHFNLGQAVVIVASAAEMSNQSRDAILRSCKNTLPNYMVPSEIVWRETLPRNPNGKIDRKTLSTDLQHLFAKGFE